MFLEQGQQCWDSANGTGMELQEVYVEQERRESSPSFGSNVISEMVLILPWL